jgi:hypothetical protein
MAVEWRVKATEMVNCNCAYGCPCQFNALPTHGDCRAACGYEIEEGHFGAVMLDGLRAAILFSWPGPIHLGNGTMQVIVDERADAAQRDALIKDLDRRGNRRDGDRLVGVRGDVADQADAAVRAHRI